MPGMSDEEFEARIAAFNRSPRVRLKRFRNRIIVALANAKYAAGRKIEHFLRGGDDTPTFWRG